ncbi:hypothetical protein BWQ96_05411 [Gracilariopsis chorda]|uniref:Uncharacterized protein n=1 Tax=Gracilariopsis chorda TaxID=448386 RepID=A0A2V3IRT7_9FLOR|nr:hypothetical protein BWQ96_05411 [Gracilariopsis chorda]|eukprot:PXF44828.1 hypothetical protein BWQ96_05411 [Gracilariopsis chorda]
MNVPLFSRPSVVNTVGSQPLGIIPNASESFMTAAKQTLPQQQQNPLHQVLRPPQQGFYNVGASASNPITFQGNNQHTMFNSGNINYQNANVSHQGFILEGGMGVQFPKVPDPNSQVLLGQRMTDLCTSNSEMPGAESMYENGGTTGDGLGNASFLGFANQQGNAGISHVSSIGDMRRSQLATIPGNETPDQMMENLLFGMGGIASSPSGAPEF